MKSLYYFIVKPFDDRYDNTRTVNGNDLIINSGIEDQRFISKKDVENTKYKFTLEDGKEVEVKGNEEIEDDGEIHAAANLYDALKEGYYGKF